MGTENMKNSLNEFKDESNEIDTDEELSDEEVISEIVRLVRNYRNNEANKNRAKTMNISNKNC